MVMMMVMMVDDYHHLRLRHIRDSEAEDENQGEQKLLHDSGWRIARFITELL
jgi:hypothetical protein